MADGQEPQARAPRFPVGLTVATAIALAILLALGSWQVQRLKWKTELLDQIAALKAAPPRLLEPALNDISEDRPIDFTRVRAVCPGLAAAPYIELYAIKEGQAGSRLISACPVESRRFRTLLVDRGFVADTISARPAVNPADRTPVEITGVLRTVEKPSLMAPKNQPEAGRWFTRDVPAMAKALGAPQPAPVFLFAENAANPGFRALEPTPVPADIPNRHLEYALTWFGLAAALVGVYAALLVRRRKI